MILQNLESRPGIIHVAIGLKDASAANEELFKKEMMKLLQTDARYMILSFEQVGYLDSTFLGSLVTCLKYALANQKDIMLVNLKKDIYDLLLLIRMDKVFKIYKDYEQAVAQI